MIAALANALAARLSATTMTDEIPSVTFQRAYTPYYDNPQLTSLKASVIPRGCEITKTSRGTEQHDYTFAIVIAKRTNGSLDQVDALLALVERICDVLRSNTMPFSDEHPWPDPASWFGLTLDPVWSQEHLEERQTFFTAITVQYRAILVHAEG